LGKVLNKKNLLFLHDSKRELTELMKQANFQHKLTCQRLKGPKWISRFLEDWGCSGWRIKFDQCNLIKSCTGMLFLLLISSPVVILIGARFTFSDKII
jgi:hypothetical protein